MPTVGRTAQQKDNMKIHLICKVCYTEMEAQFTADEINDEINLFVIPCKQCAAQQSVEQIGCTCRQIDENTIKVNPACVVHGSSANR